MRVLNNIGYAALPAAFVVHYLLRKHGGYAGWTWEPVLTFILAGVAIIPMAQLMGEATEHLAEKTGPTWGGLLNATFGNAAELIIAIVAMTRGLNEIVKASLTGSILGNLLLVSGGAMLFGGWNRERQHFSRESAQTNSSLLAVAVVGMLFPAIFHFSFRFRDAHLVEHELGVSIGTAIILILVYGLGLLFTLRTHRHIYSPPVAQTPEDPAGMSALRGGWSVRKSVMALLIASIVVAVLSELLVGSAEQAAHSLHWNPIFVGVIVLAIIGNAAEHSTALLLAHRDDMETAMTITYQSSLQIALFTTPFLVLLSVVLGSLGFGGSHPRLNLIFSPMEVAAVLLTVFVVIVIGLNGETNWFEGVLLLAVYAILGITFFYIPMAHPEGYDTQRAPAAHVAEGIAPD